MQPNLPNCLCCNQEFHSLTRIPRILYTCGHTFCSQCLQVILDEAEPCPFDSIDTPPDVQVRDLPINEAVLAVFPRLSTLSSDYCSRHQKPQDLICESEHQKICIDCSEECLYRRHTIKFLRDVEAEADEKKKEFQDFIHNFDAEYEEINPLLYEKEEVLLKEVDNNFELFQAEIDETRHHIRSVVEKYFEEQRKLAAESFNHDHPCKKKARQFSRILNQKSFDESFFKALNTSINSLAISSQKPQIEAAVSMLENHVETIGVEIKTLLARIPTLFKTQDNNDDFKVEEDGVLENGENHSLEENQGTMEQEGEIRPRMEIEEDYLRAISLFNVEIEENNRLILSFKNQQNIEAESIFNDQEKLKTISKVTLQINKSKKWKEAIEFLQWIWSKLDKIRDLRIEFSFKIHARDILEALLVHDNIWATTDLLEFAIDLSSSPVEDEHAIYLSKKAISNMVNLQKLEIVLENTRITDHSVKVFAENTLPSLPDLTDFRFYVDHTKVSDDAMESLLTSIYYKKRNLTGLAFGLDDTFITDKTIENMAKSISPFAVTLTKLDLSANKANIADNGLKILSEKFASQLEKLQEFTLDLGCTKVSNKGLEFFVKNTLPKMTSLEVFELFLNEQKKITNKIIKLIAKGLESSSNLKKICLEFAGTEISGTTLVDLEQLTLKNKPTLETFELYIAETGIKVTEINDFLVKIGSDKTFQNIKHLSFCFSQLNITDKTCELLSKSILQSAKNLQILHLTLGKNKKITDVGLISLSHGLNQALQSTKLTEFQLYLDSTKVTDQGLKVFSNQVVKSLVGVKSFKLYLILLPDVTDQGAEALFQNLSLVAESLRDVKISLYGTNITDGCMETLSKTLWNAKPKLESFTLSIGKNKNITDESLEWLLHNFKPILQSLTSLKLNVGETKVSQERIRVLKQYLQEVPNALEKLKIKVGDNRNFQEMVQDLENILI